MALVYMFFTVVVFLVSMCGGVSLVESGHFVAAGVLVAVCTLIVSRLLDAFNRSTEEQNEQKKQ